MSRKTMPTTTGVTTIGTISTIRIARMNGNSRTHRSARPEAERRLDRDRRGHELERRPERSREERIVERLAVLAEADVRDRRAEAVELRARLHARDERVDDDGQHQQHGRGEQQVGQEAIEPRPLQPRPGRALGRHQL